MSPLVVDKVHMYPLENARQHRTDRFEIVHKEEPTPVLRRGQTFFIVIRFDRGYRDDADNVTLIFSFGDKPNVMQGSKGVVSLTRAEEFTGIKTEWGVRIKGCDADVLTLEIKSPVNAPVGVWTLRVETRLATSQPEDVKIYDYPEIIFLLFNPWNKDDTVYMPEEKLLDEYVLNDVGKVWVGPMSTCKGREWVFGQFDEVVLAATMLMMDRAKLSPANRGDPIQVTRAISKMVNSNDDQGVLFGRWDGEYEDGTAPAAWTGSVAILKQYLDTGKEVFYGQCWVFAGVVTTACRALGIPSRVVSNLVSAHDANASLTVDRYYTEANDELPFDPQNEEGGEDSIWNYHVWNDVWMARPDLPVGYGGWQAIDATPQETSDGMYQCGPASLEAIRKGVAGFRYDVPFLIASVNADLVRWKEDSSTAFGYSRIETNSYHIGRKILTKQPWIYDPNGDTDIEEITTQYKSAEGNKMEERLTLYNAIQNTKNAKYFYDVPDTAQSDVTFDLVEIDKINIGENFAVVIKIQNNSDEVRTVQAALSASSVFYNGAKAHMIKKSSGEFKMQPKSSEQLRLTVRPDDYLEKLVEYCILKIFAICKVVETRQTWAGEDDFQIITPNLKVIVPEFAPVGLSTMVTFKFKNPLKKSLTNCKFTYEGPGVAKVNKIPYRDIRPEEEVIMEHRFTPYQSGEHKIVATFTSKQLLDITGSAVLDITE